MVPSDEGGARGTETGFELGDAVAAIDENETRFSATNFTVFGRIIADGRGGDGPF